MNVVLVHGIRNTGSIFRKTARYLEARGFKTYTPSLRPNSGRVGLEVLAQQLSGYIDRHLTGDEPFYLIGFSMGGLITRHYVQRLGGSARVRRLITISTPHNGTRMAFLQRRKGVQQMRPGSPFLNDLNSDSHELERLRIASIWTPLDLMIVPARSSRLLVGTEITIPVILHPLMITDRRALAAIVRLLD